LNFAGTVYCSSCLPQNVFCSVVPEGTATIRLRVGDTSPAPIDISSARDGRPIPYENLAAAATGKLGHSTAADLTVGTTTPRAAKPSCFVLTAAISALTTAEKAAVLPPEKPL